MLIKAVAGGGGKGMRKVDAPEDFADALLSCQREAASSFANNRVLLEKWIATPRHIEVQVFGDTHGNVVHLFERDCSLQRRHQKVIEEAPAPGMSEEARARICQAAVKAAKAVNYVGAGTIEFIADGSAGLHPDKIWFMEMNTRLQVEHPVTEQITEQDLVEWQLRVASGEPLPKRQDELSISGWAMEARLYAEDPAKRFLPSVGRLDLFEIGGDVRIDTGVEQGTEISPFYDPMIAKVIASGPDRDTARRALAASLEGTKIWPLRTNAGFLVRTLQHPDFIEARLDTELIAREGFALIPPDRPSETALAKGVAEALTASRIAPAGFRLNASLRNEASFLLNGAAVAVAFDPAQVGAAPSVKTAAGAAWIAEGGQVWKLQPWRVDGAGGIQVSEGTILSSMPGKVIAVSVKDGEAVVKGQKLVTLEAMKMEHSLTAPFDGTVTELNAHEGAQVSEGTLLVKVTPMEAA